MAFKIIDYRKKTRLGRNYGLRAGARPKAIIIHATAGHKAGDLQALTKGNAAGKAGVHVYITKEGTRYRMVSDGFSAYGAGLSKFPGETGLKSKGTSVNRWVLQVELENLNNGKDPYTDAQYDSLAELVHRWAGKYRIPWGRVLGHFQVSPGRKTDPRGFEFKKLRAILRKKYW